MYFLSKKCSVVDKNILLGTTKPRSLVKVKVICIFISDISKGKIFFNEVMIFYIFNMNLTTT